jgi:predicted SnoaL-like aldol condensation-catalyzing enzyme
MKRLSLAAAGMLCLFSACNNTQSGSSSGSSAAQKNLDAMNVVVNAFKTGDVSGIDNVVAADFVDHTDKGDMGRDSLKAMIVQMHKAMPDMKMETIKEVADSEYVFQMVHYSGTGDGMMMPPGPFDMRGIEVVRMKDGKGVEHWGFVNGAEMMKIMSKMPSMANQMAAGMADTSMKKK